MKKHLIILTLISFANAASAADSSFSSRADANAAQRKLSAAAEQRSVDQLKASQDIVVELQKSNALSAEISTKLDKLIESSDANNLLMDTLLKRTE